MYILTEQVMNGTVTIQITTMLVDAPDFQTAKNKVKSLLEQKKSEWGEGLAISYYSDDDEALQFTILGSSFPVNGRMMNKQATIL